jgi:beta-galactosidase
LTVNGLVVGEVTGDRVFVFTDVPIRKGENLVCAKSETAADEAMLFQVEEAESSYVHVDPNPGFEVKNWFTLGKGEEDLFPADRYSIMDDIGTLAGNPKIWSLLEEMLPQVTGNPRNRSMPRISLLRVLNRISGQLEEGFVKLVNQRLNRIRKPAGPEEAVQPSLKENGSDE